MDQAKSFPRYKRRAPYINKDFQLNFIVKFCVLTGCGTVLAMGLMYWLAKNSTTVAIKQSHVAVHTTADYLLPLMLQTVLLECIIGCIATVFLVMIINRKIAGPLHELKIMFPLLAEGNLSTPMHLRPDDQLKDVAQAYNHMINKLNSKIKALKNISSLDAAKRELDKFKTS